METPRTMWVIKYPYCDETVTDSIWDSHSKAEEALAKLSQSSDHKHDAWIDAYELNIIGGEL